MWSLQHPEHSKQITRRDCLKSSYLALWRYPRNPDMQGALFCSGLYQSTKLSEAGRLCPCCWIFDPSSPRVFSSPGTVHWSFFLKMIHTYWGLTHTQKSLQEIPVQHDVYENIGTVFTQYLANRKDICRCIYITNIYPFYTNVTIMKDSGNCSLVNIPG